MGLEELQGAMDWQRAEEVFQKHDYAYEEKWEVSLYKVYRCGNERRIYLQVIKWVPRKVAGAPYKSYIRRVYDLPLDQDGYVPLTTESGAVFAGVCVPRNEPHFCGILSETSRDHDPRNMREALLSKEAARARSKKQSSQRSAQKRKIKRSQGLLLPRLPGVSPGEEVPQANEGQINPEKT